MSSAANTEKPEQTSDQVEEELKTATAKAVKASEFGTAPTESLVIVRDYLHDAIEKNRVAQDPVFAKFLYEECAKLTKGLTKK